MQPNFSSLLTATEDENVQRFANAKIGVQQYLAGLATVKIFIADSRSFGHQSSSINILFNLIRLGCRATFTVVYENDEALEKVRVLLPIDPDRLQPITLATPDGGTVNINFLSYTDTQPHCDLALTGGYDHAVETLAGLNATYIVDLQPFKWRKGENVIYNTAAHTTYPLDEARKGFNQLAFYLDIPVRADAFWSRFVTAYPSWTLRVNLTAKVLSLYGTTKNFYLCPVYGINTGMIDPIISLFNLCCGIAYLQDQTTVKPSKKAVVVSFSPYKQSKQDNNVDLKTLEKLITQQIYKGGYYDPNQDCKTYLNTASLAARVQYYSGTNVADLEAAIAGLAANQILVVQIGPVPAPMFNYVYSVANLPFVFEGQNTATLALNLGVPYLHITTLGSYDNLFPNLPVGNTVATRNGDVATTICSKMSTLPGTWRSAGAVQPTSTTRSITAIEQSAPSFILGKYALTAIQADAQNSIIQYFQKFQTFFHDEKNDKLLIALIYLKYNIIDNKIYPNDIG